MSSEPSSRDTNLSKPINLRLAVDEDDVDSDEEPLIIPISSEENSSTPSNKSGKEGSPEGSAEPDSHDIIVVPAPRYYNDLVPTLEDATGSSQRIVAIPKPSSVVSGESRLYKDVIPTLDDPIFELELASCFISCEITSVQPAPTTSTTSSSSECLVIALFTFHPEHHYRFRTARLALTVKPHSPSTVPSVKSFAPKTTYGGYSKVDSSWKFSLTAPVSVPGSIFSIEPGGEYSKSRTVDHYMTIQGSSRGTPRNRCVWTMEENEDSASGLPLNFQVAMVVASKGLFEVDVGVKAKVAGRMITRQVKSLEDGVRIIDPKLKHGTLVGFEMGTGWNVSGFEAKFSGAVGSGSLPWEGVIPSP